MIYCFAGVNAACNDNEIQNCDDCTNPPVHCEECQPSYKQTTDNSTCIGK